MIFRARIDFPAQRDWMTGSCEAENLREAWDTFRRMFPAGIVAKVWKAKPKWLKQREAT